ncbi:hypothetical protein HPB50_008194 [Hyalomma asiaticum]|uniref:Uncharacterized protein n=1 Tax=Hyalomma asiaticum TaxID=266040 RepID=A0ACB7SDD6_HYAAI|nr:hypothetical protein HPB50_008194 [Hyalomma asiaticum]
MPTCFVPGCTSGYRKNPEKRYFSSPPSDPLLLQKWERSIPRADNTLGKTCKCACHVAAKDEGHQRKGHLYLNKLCGYLAICQKNPRNRYPLLQRTSVFFSTPVEKTASLQLPRRWSLAVPEEPGKPPVIVFYNAEFKEDIYCILKSTVIHEDLTYVVSANRKLLKKLPFDIPLQSLKDIGDHQANYQHYERLFEAEKKAAFKVVPKLTEYHVKPEKLQTMCVRLAAQLFSRSVSIGLKVYRQMKVPGFADSAGTQEFTLLLNDLFDILNSKIKFLERFLEMKNQTEAMNVKLSASRQTIKSLRVALMSVLSLTDFLLGQGVNYILTASLNRDPLDSFHPFCPAMLC